MTRRIWVFPVVSLCGLFAAQDFAYRHTIRGKVVSEDGRPVAKARVKLKNLETRFIQSYISQDSGEFHFAGLTTNAGYEIWAEKASRKSDTEYLSRYDVGEARQVELKLKE